MLNPVVKINAEPDNLTSTLQGRVVYTLRAMDAKFFRGFLGWIFLVQSTGSQRAAEGLKCGP